jgi:hypothetical protein
MPYETRDGSLRPEVAVIEGFSHDIPLRDLRLEVTWNAYSRGRFSATWLYRHTRNRVLAIATYGNGAGLWIYPSEAESIHQPSSDFRAKDLGLIAEKLGIFPADLRAMWDDFAYYTSPSSAIRWAGTEGSPAAVPNQWVELPYNDPAFDYRARFKKIRAETPPFLQDELIQAIRERRHVAFLDRNRFSWENAYPPDVVRKLHYEFERFAETHPYMDNRRVAKVGNRQHLHHYRKAKERGCCGSFDTIVKVGLIFTDSYHLGFNYGH